MNILLFFAVIVSGIFNWRPGSITEWIAVIISGGALIVSGFALTFLRGTFAAAEEQIRVAKKSSETENRPWIKADVFNVQYSFDRDDCV